TRFSRDWSSDVCSSDLSRRNTLSCRRNGLAFSRGLGCRRTLCSFCLYVCENIENVLVREGRERCHHGRLVLIEKRSRVFVATRDDGRRILYKRNDPIH